MSADHHGLRVVARGEGARFGNVEFLALSEDSARFNLSLITMRPHADGPPLHVHAEEDDAFFITRAS